MRTFPVRALVAVALVSVVMVPTAQADGQNKLKLNGIQHRLLSGQADLLLNHTDEQIGARGPNRGGGGNAGGAFYFPSEDDQCPQNLGPDVKVNEDCQNLSDAPAFAGRGQAQNETSIAYDPNDPKHLVATFNDYRRGDGNCGGSFSLDGGQNWANIVVPMSFTLGGVFGAFARQYWQAGGDTSVAWDTRGNAYFSCQVFNRGTPTSPNPDQSSAMLVFRSTQNEGGSWNFPGRYVTFANDVEGTGTILEDKQLITVDNHPGSPFRDRVYVTWTEFAPDGSAYIWAANSADYGESFSSRKLVSVTSPTLCTVTFGVPTAFGTCNENQFSQPFTAPDGTLYVVYNNYNNPTALAPKDDAGDDSTPGDGAPAPAPTLPLTCGAQCENRNQILLAKSTDGGNTFTGPVKVADYYDLPDCITYQAQDAGRACVPEKGPTQNSFFRATNYASGAVNPNNSNQVIVTLGSYINKYSNESLANPCVPAGINPSTGQDLYVGVKTPGACNNKILISVSNNAGASFTGTTTNPRQLATVNQARGQIGTDQWWQWAAFAPNGRLAVSYYDRQYGNDETTGFSDFSLSGSSDLARFGVARATTASSPPPTDFGGLFWGDYTGLTAPGMAYPIWGDTRNPELVLCPGTGTPGNPPKTCTTNGPNASPANDEDVFTRAMPIPRGGDDGD